MVKGMGSQSSSMSSILDEHYSVVHYRNSQIKPVSRAGDGAWIYPYVHKKAFPFSFFEARKFIGFLVQMIDASHHATGGYVKGGVLDRMEFLES